MKNKNDARIYSKAALALFSVGALIIVAAMIYLIANLEEKSNSLFYSWLVSVMIGLLVITTSLKWDKKEHKNEK